MSRVPGGKQHKETRRRALVFEKIRERVRRVQDDRDSAGPVRYPQPPSAKTLDRKLPCER